jgi:hypothetical protein
LGIAKPKNQWNTHLLSEGRNAQEWVKALLYESLPQKRKSGLFSELVPLVTSLLLRAYRCSQLQNKVYAMVIDRKNYSLNVYSNKPSQYIYCNEDDEKE